MLKENVKKLYKDVKEIDNGGIITTQSIEMVQAVLDVPNIANFVETVITDGAVALVDENDTIEAEILGEMEVANEKDIQLTNDKVIGEKKARITTNVKATKQLLNDSIDFTENAVAVMNKRVARTLANVIVNGNEKFEGQCLCDIEATLTEELTVDSLRNLMLEMKEEYLSNACFILAEDDFKVIAKVKKANGEYEIKFNPHMGLYEINGLPIFVMKELKAKALLVNLHQAYKLVVSPNVDLRSFEQDAFLALSGVDGLINSIYVDGAIKNKAAIKKLA
ncbi:phage major capsid protein [Clostridium disporicum]|uniref:phage major capsid protein n=1 Tax=Clostridium disporicum TaxID=84024 RepID=UPI00362243EC